MQNWFDPSKETEAVKWTKLEKAMACLRASLSPAARANRKKQESLQKKFQTAQIQLEQNPCKEFEKILDKCKTESEKFYDEKAH